jgi:orotidine-5'-phosphate decarboxylase
MDPHQRLIVPLDVPRFEDALQWIDRLPDVQHWKVGLELFVSSGPAILAALKSREKGIFLDLKFHDIPNTMTGACSGAAAYGVTWLTVHATAGGKALAQSAQALSDTAQSLHLPTPTLLAVTLLTSLSPQDLARDLQVSQDVVSYVQHLATLAQANGAGGVVCSPQEIAAVRQVCAPPFQIVCPGIRPAWATTGDQQRTLTPRQAIEAGADYLVIGRPITQAADPQAALQRLWEE